MLNRIKEYIDSKGISVSAFEKSIGMSNASFGKSLKNGGTIGSDKLGIILSVYPDINAEWLITGKGEMLRNQREYKTETVSLKVQEERPHYETTSNKSRPFIDAFYGTLGQPNGFVLAVRADECERISIPFVNDYDFSIKGRGDSMINRKNPDRSICDGDLIACKFWASRSHIRWGQVYALATSEGVIIKQVRESERDGYVKCVSFNEEDGYNPYDLPVEEIYDWALVVSVTHTSKW